MVMFVYHLFSGYSLGPYREWKNTNVAEIVLQFHSQNWPFTRKLSIILFFSEFTVIEIILYNVLMKYRVRGDWTRRQSAVEAPYHPELDPVTERQQILESILRTTRWPTTNNIAVMQDNPQQFSQPLSSPVKAKDVPEVGLLKPEISQVS